MVEMTAVPLADADQLSSSISVFEDDEIHPNLLWVLNGTDLLVVIRDGLHITYRKVAP